VLLNDLVRASAAIAEDSSRLAKIGHLATLLRALAPQEVDVAIGFLSGEPRQGRMGLGPSTIWQARATDAADDPTLTLLEADETFARISTARGAGSPAERSRLLRDLLRRATREEQDFLARLLVGELRQGALEGVLLEAVARASNIPSSTVRRATMMAGALAPVAHAALIEGESGLDRFSVQLFRPVQPMLAQPADDLDEALANIDADLALEWKLDGARIQVHKAGDDIKVFSRNLRDVTAAVPEIVETVRALAVREAIFDGEVIALKPDRSPHDFQVTMQRFGRKLDVDRLRAELPLVPFFFDCLYVDGAVLVDESQEHRFSALDSIARPLIVPHRTRPTREEAGQFLNDTLARGHEGVMAKALGSSYEAGRRGQNWLKIKAARTLDLVVLAAEWGHGRRKGWLSNLHLGARDPVNGAFVMLGKTFKGMTDQMLAWQTERLLALEITRDDYTVHVRPELVVEIAFNGVQDSPHYPGGLALRFARVKAYRPEKSASEADTIDTVRQIRTPVLDGPAASP
jgi:ATP-dependent DNA ligase I